MLLRTLAATIGALYEGSAMDTTTHDQPAPWPQDRPTVQVVTRPDRGQLVLLVRGEADADTSDQMRADLTSALRQDPARVCVDVSELSFCDLAGSDALHQFVDAAEAMAIPVELRGMSPLLAILYTEFAPIPREHAEDRPTSGGL